MSAVHVPVAGRLVGGGREAGVPVVDVTGHEQSQLQDLGQEQNQGQIRLRIDCFNGTM